MALRQRGLDRGLALQQPIERLIEFVLVHFAKAKHFAEARCRGGGRQCAGGSQFGCRIENTPDKKRKDKITATIPVRAEDTVKANPADGAESGRDVAMWQTANDGESFTLRGMTVPPLSTPRSPSMWAAGQSDRLQRVRLRTLPCSR
jgi:hypothetical protein